LGGRRGLVLLEFAPIVVGMEDGVEKTVSRSDAENRAADGSAELPESVRERGCQRHMEFTSLPIGFIGVAGDSDNFVNIRQGRIEVSLARRLKCEKKFSMCQGTETSGFLGFTRTSILRPRLNCLAKCIAVS
jgi:hypothetical protein